MMGDFQADYTPGEVALKIDRQGKVTTQQIDVKEVVYDNEQVLYLIRRLPLKVGYEAAFPIFGVQEWMPFDRAEQICEVVGPPCRVEDGYAMPHETPGLGVDINESAAAKYPYKPAYMPLVRREDGTMFVY